MEIIFQLLTDVRKVPQIYLGEKSLTYLKLLIDGAICAIAKMTGEFVEYAPGFLAFVQKRLNAGGEESVTSAILRYCASEEEAFDYFFELLDEFMASVKISNGEPT